MISGVVPSTGKPVGVGQAILFPKIAWYELNPGEIGFVFPQCSQATHSHPSGSQTEASPGAQSENLSSVCSLTCSQTKQGRAKNPSPVPHSDVFKWLVSVG